jgi:hypothetical protein
MPTFDGPIVNWGRFSFLLHDNGWWLACNDVIRISSRYPSTGYRLRRKIEIAIRSLKSVPMDKEG